MRGRSAGLPPVSWCLERLPLLVLLLCVTFLQGYALLFWSNLLGRAGWGVSVGLEVLHLWFWYRAATVGGVRRAAWMLLALVATGLLLAGALHEVTRPLRAESMQVQVNAQQQAALAAEAQQLTANLAAFREMAAGQQRRGWQADIRRDTAQLQAVTRQLNALNSSRNTARQPWLTQVTYGGVIAVAVLFQVAAVLAVWSLSAGTRNAERAFRPVSVPKTTAEPAAKHISVPAETFRAMPTPAAGHVYRQLWRQIEAHSRGSAGHAGGNGRVSQAALAKALGISAPDLSAIKLLAQGQTVPRKPSREAVEILAKRFGISVPK